MKVWIKLGWAVLSLLGLVFLGLGCTSAMHVYGAQKPSLDSSTGSIESKRPVRDTLTLEGIDSHGISCTTVNNRSYVCYVYVDYKDGSRYIAPPISFDYRSDEEMRIARRKANLRSLDLIDSIEIGVENQHKMTVDAKHWKKP